MKSLDDNKDYQRLFSKLGTDLTTLDDDWVELPQLTQEAGEFAAWAVRVRDSLKHQLDITEAEVSHELGMKINSEAGIKRRLPMEPEVSAAREKYEDAKQDAAVWQSLAESYRTKNSTLKHLSELMVAGYFAPPSDRRRGELTERRRARAG